MKKLLSTIFGLILSVSVGASQEAQFSQVDLESLGLDNVKSSAFRVAYVREGFSVTSPVFVAEMDSSATEIVEDRNSSRMANRQRDSWEFSSEDEEKFAQEFAKGIDAAFEGSDIELAEGAAADQLTVTPRFVKFRPNAPRDTLRNRGPGEEVYSEGTGDMWVVFEGRVNDELVFWVETKSRAGTMMEQNNRVSTTRNMSLVLKRWARSLERQLNDLK